MAKLTDEGNTCPTNRANVKPEEGKEILSKEAPGDGLAFDFVLATTLSGRLPWALLSNTLTLHSS